MPIRELVYARDVVDSLGDILRRCLGEVRPQRVAVVADARTWEISGDRARAALQGAGLTASRVLVADRGLRSPMCDDVTCRALVEQLRPLHVDAVVAVGSGVINDLSKWASFELGIPYVVVATAESMNGYSSANVAPTIAGVKMLIEAKPPLAVVADPVVIEGAPHEMTAAGFGDTIAKHQSNGDWAMNSLLLDEHHCGFCAGIARDIEPLYLDHPEHIRDHRPQAVEGLFEALFWTGAAMTLMGTSIPASGGEHLLSHTLDMMAEVRGETHDLHGRQVGVGTVLSAALFERVLAVESPDVGCLPPPVDEAFWIDRSIRRGRGAGAGSGQATPAGVPAREDQTERSLGPGQGEGRRTGQEPADDPQLVDAGRRRDVRGRHRLLASADSLGCPAHARDPQTSDDHRSGLVDGSPAGGPGRHRGPVAVRFIRRLSITRLVMAPGTDFGRAIAAP
ncbi:MAG TPA: iron-containing alcohol dehydrogenase [Sedimentisphaerales bacterium]|nr:iron-containing alcohol dehydrogenase [Sedimentisphaerales bacterium]